MMTDEQQKQWEAAYQYENGKLRAEIERLQRDYGILSDIAAQLERENARLLVALENITKVESGYEYDWGVECQNIAQSAIDGPKD